MSQLRQPGDYLKNNRTGASPPHVHTFTAESNQKVENKFFQKEDSCPRTAREKAVRDSNQESSELDTEKGQLYTVHEREQTYKTTLRKGCQQRTTQEFKQELWHNRWTMKPTRNN